MDVDITMLGGFSVQVDGATVMPVAWGRQSATALVKVLALEPQRRLHREQVIDRLWPGSGIRDGSCRLHKAAHYARRALGGTGTVVLARQTVALFPARRVRVDALHFDTLAAAATVGRDVDAAARAADAYPGDLLPDDIYQPWAQDHRERLRLLYLETLRLAGRWERLTSIEPTDEDAHLQMIIALARRGDRSTALRQFDRLERVLRRELGVAPSRRALELRARLLSADHSSASGRIAGHPPGRGTMEREQLDHLLPEVGDNSGRVLFVNGPAGAGKTPLLARLERRAAERGLCVGTGVSLQIEVGWPYAPVLESIADLTRRQPGLLEQLPARTRSDIENALTGGDLRRSMPTGHQRLFLAIAALIRVAAAGRGVVLVIDDAHHADTASLRLLHYLARSTAMEPVLFVLAHRPQSPQVLQEIRQSLIGRGGAVTLDLDVARQEKVPA